MRYSYNNLVAHAKWRGIFLDLTFEQFCKFCYKCDYMHKKGRGKENYAIDRKIVGRLPGYTVSNIQPSTTSANSQKRWKEYDYISRGIFIRKEIVIEPGKDLPF